MFVVAGAVCSFASNVVILGDGGVLFVLTDGGLMRSADGGLIVAKLVPAVTCTADAGPFFRALRRHRCRSDRECVARKLELVHQDIPACVAGTAAAWQSNDVAASIDAIARKCGYQTTFPDRACSTPTCRAGECVVENGSALEPRVPMACASDDMCPHGLFCSCGVRMTCRFMVAGTDGGVCLSPQEAIDRGAALAAPEGSLHCGDGGWCHAVVPWCRADSECPRGTWCVCDSKACRFSSPSAGDFDHPDGPPWTTQGCLGDAGFSFDRRW